MILMAAILNLCVGSFLTALVYRIQHGFSLLSRSFCPSCKTSLHCWHLVPLVSWLWYQGHCTFCGSPIPWRYPFIEITTMIVGIIPWWMGWTMHHALWMNGITWVLLFIMIMDHDVGIIPMGGLIGLFMLLFLPLWYHNTYLIIEKAYLMILLGMMGGLMAWGSRRLLKKQGLGGGDIKMMALSGLGLEIGYLPLFCMLAGGLGLIMHGWTQREKIPFGVALGMSLWVCIFLAFQDGLS